MIRRFYVHNYKCLENFELPLGNHHSILLIGKNGSGKSTVGRALQVLQRLARGINRVGELVSPKDFCRGNSNVPIRFEIEVEIAGATFAYSLALELPPGFNELRIAEEKFVHQGAIIYERSTAQVALSRAASSPESRFRVDWHLVALPLILEQSTQDPLHILKNWLARMMILAPVPSDISGDSSGVSLFPDESVSNFGEWFAGLLTHSPSSYSTFENYVRQAMPDFKDIQNPIVAQDARSLTVQFEQSGTILAIPFSDLSDGEKCFFVAALVMASATNLPFQYSPVFCFWDEPDNFFSLSEVGTFIVMLRRRFNLGGQLVVTSHNGLAIERFSAENTFLLTRRSHLEPTMILAIANLQFAGELQDALARDELTP